MTLTTVSLLACALAAQAAPEAPARSKAPQPTRSSLDYSAQVVGPGQVRVGIGELDIGVLRGLQLGTDPVLDLVGVYNVRGRAGGLVGSHLGLVVEAAGHSLELGEHSTRHLRVGSTGSAWVGPLGLHLGARVSRLWSAGTPDLAAASPTVTALVGDDGLASAQEGVSSPGLDLRVQATTVSLRGAVELRVAPAHALVLQGGDALSRELVLDRQAQDVLSALPEGSSLSDMLTADQGGAAWGSLSWQVSGRRLRMRGGLGLSDVPFTWLSPSLELSWVLGELEPRDRLST